MPARTVNVSVRNLLRRRLAHVADRAAELQRATRVGMIAVDLDPIPIDRGDRVDPRLAGFLAGALLSTGVEWLSVRVWETDAAFGGFVGPLS